MKNAHGDIVYAVTESGAKKFSGTYDAWGVIEDSYGSGTNPIGYAGEYCNEESGLIYLRGRHYDLEVRRFITEDPAKDGVNWYAYCGNNLVMLVDSSGLAPKVSGEAVYIINDKEYTLSLNKSADLDNVDWHELSGEDEEIWNNSEQCIELLDYPHIYQGKTSMCAATSMSEMIQWLTGKYIDNEYLYNMYGRGGGAAMTAKRIADGGYLDGSGYEVNPNIWSLGNMYDTKFHGAPKITY